MNCKPDDLAVVVRDTCLSSSSLCYRGAVVQVKRPVFGEGGTLFWTVDHPVKCVRSRGWCQRDEFPDYCLQPIKGEEGEHRGDVKVKNTEQPDKLTPVPQLDRSGAQ